MPSAPAIVAQRGQVPGGGLTAVPSICALSATRGLVFTSPSMVESGRIRERARPSSPRRRRPSARSSFCSARAAPTRRMMAESPSPNLHESAREYTSSRERLNEGDVDHVTDKAPTDRGDTYEHMLQGHPERQHWLLLERHHGGDRRRRIRPPGRRALLQERSILRFTFA